ncbi:MAG TPA: histidine kinase dimerization/phospho-acceptor domain-containing protein, partial [Flavobacteriales bacterium]|nr:histidine kinase dimerization/phospho-acceptor domain-containing protein [Flavobacteriales bacterium]
MILILVSLFTYYLSSEFRKEEFFERLSKKAQTTARLLIEIDEIDLDLLKIIDRSDFGTLPEEAIYIYTQEGQLIYQSNDVSIFVPDSSMIERVKRGEHYFEYKKDIEVYGYTYADIDHPYIIIAGALDRFGLSKLNNLRNILVLVFLTGILLVAIAGWIFSGKALSPISDVVSQVNAISINHLERRVDEGNNTDEISLMASTFNRLLDRIEEAFQMQTQFVANASHELRTPLTVLSGQLEVALLKERTPEQYQIILTSLKEDLSLLNQTANRLLLLAQADSRAENLDARPFR